jgi:zinc protease
MEDLTAASHSDVVEFFKKYYAPNNASLVVAGDIDIRDQSAGREVVQRDPARRRRRADRSAAAILTEVKKKTTDRSRALRGCTWLADAAHVRAGRCALDMVVVSAERWQELASLQAARLRHANRAGRRALPAVRRDRQRVPDRCHGSPRPHARELQKVIDEELEKLRREPPEPREVQRAINQIEASFYRAWNASSNKADSLNGYYFAGAAPTTSPKTWRATHH